MTKRILRVLPILFTIFIINSDLFASYYKSDTIYFKGNNDYPPYQLVNSNGQPEGFSIDLINAIARTMGLTIKIELGDWNTVRNELETGKIDGLAAMS